MSEGPPPEIQNRSLPAIGAAQAFVRDRFATCFAALLSGSLARGEPRAHSDLDVLIATDEIDRPYRETFRAYGWVIEAFVENRSSIEEKLVRSGKSRNPSFLRSCAEAIILADQGSFAQNLIDTARALMKEGPPPLTPDEIRKYRYIITDWLDDLADADSYEESLFIVYELVSKAAELLLGQERRWIGERKWLYKALKESDNRLAAELMNRLLDYYQGPKLEPLIETVEAILKPVGGRLYEGFSDYQT